MLPKRISVESMLKLSIFNRIYLNIHEIFSISSRNNTEKLGQNESQISTKCLNILKSSDPAIMSLPLKGSQTYPRVQCKRMSTWIRLSNFYSKL